MKTTSHPNAKEIVSSYHQQNCEGDQTDRKVTPIDAYLRSKGLSSKDMSSQQIDDTFLQRVHCNNVADIYVALGVGAKSVEIPADVLRELAEVEPRLGHRDSPGEKGPNGADILREIATMRNKREKDGT